MKKANIAILGATSHIAKGLIDNFLRSRDFSLHLYARAPEKVSDFLSSIGRTAGDDCHINGGYDSFSALTYDVVINCIGVGTLNKLQGDYTRYFTVTEEYDNLTIRYLTDTCPDALYISFSSGAVYGRGHSTPVDEDSLNRIAVNRTRPEDYYSIVRLYTEAKHRAFSGLKIVDLRLFSYFSRFIDLTDGYFMTDVMNSILDGQVLLTDSVNIVRDYLHPEDLFTMVIKCLATDKINAALDVFSTCPVEKKEILDFFSEEYGLKYELGQSLVSTGATGSKRVYFSKYDAASRIGYMPEFSSMDAIRSEAKYILSGMRK